MKSVLLTGAAGFAGSHIAKHLLEATDFTVYCLDCLTYAGRLDRLAPLVEQYGKRCVIVYHDLRQPLNALLRETPSFIIHNAGETHVWRSIERPQDFLDANVNGTLNALRMGIAYMARRGESNSLEKFIYTSTDEVFGEGEKRFLESDPLNPSNPYSATKAAGEYLARSYHRSYGLPVIVTRTMNMFGEMQHPEKFVPAVIGNLMRGIPPCVDVDENGESGSRQWLHPSTQAKFLLYLLNEGCVGETYHLGGLRQSNRQMIENIAKLLGLRKPNIHARWVKQIHPGHDMHYAIDDSKIRQVLQLPGEVEFADSLKKTVEWYMRNPEWLVP